MFLDSSCEADVAENAPTVPESVDAATDDVEEFSNEAGCEPNVTRCCGKTYGDRDLRST